MSEIQIASLSREEKVDLLEAIWADLSRSDDDVASPPWHEERLRKTEERLRKGSERVFDWEDAKRELRFRQHA